MKKLDSSPLIPKEDYLSNGWIPIADDEVVLATDRFLWMGKTPTSLVIGSSYIGKTPGQISKEEGCEMTFLRYDENRDLKIYPKKADRVQIAFSNRDCEWYWIWYSSQGVKVSQRFPSEAEAKLARVQNSITWSFDK